MNNKILYSRNLKVFFIGIGGVSMRGLAKYLISRGYIVSGSDKVKTCATKELEKLGVNVFYSHCASNIANADAVVYSCAISKDNPEFCQAKKLGLPLIKRSVLLGEILNEYKRSVAISGCHGKTTTTAMLSLIMIKARQAPTVFLGGEYPSYGNLLLGNSDLAIAEACEYKKSFLDVNAKISVVLNLDNDHLDSFDGMKDVVSSFKSFIGSKLAVINADEKYINELSNCTTVTFGIDNVATYYAKDIQESVNGISFTACAYAKSYGRINLKLNGRHNVYNALASFAVSDLLGASFEAVKSGLEEFAGVGRRNEYLGEALGVKYYADYAHHPSEIRATLDAFNVLSDDYITVFQPHTYSRTKLLMGDFISAFKGLDNLIIYKTFPARERFDKKGSALTLKKNLDERVNTCLYAQSKKELKECIELICNKNERKKRIIFLGAGDIYQIAKQILKECRNVQKKFLKR